MQLAGDAKGTGISSFVRQFEREMIAIFFLCLFTKYNELFKTRIQEGKMTRNGHIFVLSLGTLAMLIGGIYVSIKSVYDPACYVTEHTKDDTDTHTDLRSHWTSKCAILIAVILIAFLSYASMTAMVYHGEKMVNRLWEVRHLDWLITTPLLLLHLARMAQFRPTPTWALILADVVMIAAGAAATVSSTFTWTAVWFTVSMLAFFVVLALLYTEDYWKQRDEKDGKDERFVDARAYTTALWVLYPAVWVLLHGSFDIPNVEVVAASMYAILDVLAKAVFAVLFFPN